MKIGKKFNQLSKSEYVHYISNYKKYTDFNTLGLYRSILENEKLNLEDQIELRDYANTHFQKTFDFLQIKDPNTYFKLTTLGMELTRADYWTHWRTIRENQEKILKDKRIKHRNFGVYSKHECGFEDCPYNGVMFKQGSWWLGNIHDDLNTPGIKQRKQEKKLNKHKDWKKEENR